MDGQKFSGLVISLLVFFELLYLDRSYMLLVDCYDQTQKGCQFGQEFRGRGVKGFGEGGLWNFED